MAECATRGEADAAGALLPSLGVSVVGCERAGEEGVA